MTSEEYQQLETLLNKLNTEIGNKVCVIPQYHHGGIYLGTYNSAGTIATQVMAPTLERAVIKTKELLKESSLHPIVNKLSNLIIEAE